MFYNNRRKNQRRRQQRPKIWVVIINFNITKPKCWLGGWSNYCQLQGHFDWAVRDLQSSNQRFEYCLDHQLIASPSLPNSPPDHDNISFLYTHGATEFLYEKLFMFILTIIVETSPSLEHFFHSPMLKCLKILTLGCCQTARKKKQSCMLKCCISKFYNTVTICHKRNISPRVQLWWGLLFLSTEYYIRAPVTWTLRGNEKQFELAGNSSYWSCCLRKIIKCTNIHHRYKHW